MHGHRWGLAAVKADTAPLLSSVEAIDGEADLEELTASSEAAVETGATLAARQADALEAASQELLCSPDITKYASDQLLSCHALALNLPLWLWPLSCSASWRFAFSLSYVQSIRVIQLAAGVPHHYLGGYAGMLPLPMMHQGSVWRLQAGGDGALGVWVRQVDGLSLRAHALRLSALVCRQPARPRRHRARRLPQPVQVPPLAVFKSRTCVNGLIYGSLLCIHTLVDPVVLLMAGSPICMYQSPTVGCRCQFETGEAQAQEFNLIEVAAGMFGRSRRLIFKASSMEECCEWAIVLREAIAECSRK